MRNGVALIAFIVCIAFGMSGCGRRGALERQEAAKQKGGEYPRVYPHHSVAEGSKYVENFHTKKHDGE